MSGTNTGVPSVLAYELPRPVPADEFAACPVGDVFRRVGDKWSMLLVVLLGGARTGTTSCTVPLKASVSAC
jgi:hypothetical protein